MSFLNKIREMEKSNGNSWKPENIGDCIAGEAVSGLRDLVTKFGKRTAIDIRSEEDGLVYTIWAGTVIENELKKQGAEIGDQIGLKFLGQKKNYKDFVVLVEKKVREPLEDSPFDGEENRDPDFERDSLEEQG